MTNNILKEAIADAKAVREVALANAKAALEEAFTPKLQSMLSAKLSEDLEEDYYEDEDLDEVGDEMYDETVESIDYDDVDEDMTYDEGEEDFSGEIDLEEILNELELEDDEADEELVDEAKADNDDEDVDLEEIMKPHYEAGDVQKTSMTTDLYEDKEFDLNSLLKEINDLEDNDETTEGTQINESVFAAIGGLVALLGAAGTTAAIEDALSDPTIAEKHPKLAKVFELLGKIGNSGLSSGIKEEETDFGVEDDSEELAETKAALTAVKTELNEVNLLNSKLLYVNRIFKANNLDEGQKLRVVETLDNAETTKEAKLIYETIKDSFRIAKSEKVSKKAKSLSEGFKGMASKAAGMSTARKPILTESNDMVTRMQKLANIKINQ